jgi:hypothetical protein
MADRRLAILVAVAVVGGAAVAGVGLATEGSTTARRLLQVDERTGRIGRVVLGETGQNVIGTLGKPRKVDHGGGVTFVYPRLVVSLGSGRVVAIGTEDPEARTNLAVAMGQPLSAARASYRKAAHCVPNSPDKTAKHPHCMIKVPSGWLLIGGDPIKSIALSRIP